MDKGDIKVSSPPQKRQRVDSVLAKLRSRRAPKPPPPPLLPKETCKILQIKQPVQQGSAPPCKPARISKPSPRQIVILDNDQRPTSSVSGNSDGNTKSVLPSSVPNSSNANSVSVDTNSNTVAAPLNSVKLSDSPTSVSKPPAAPSKRASSPSPPVPKHLDRNPERLRTNPLINQAFQSPKQSPGNPTRSKKGALATDDIEDSYHCDVCEEDLSHTFRVRCAECPDYDLCVTCFARGFISSCHSNSHAYMPVGPCNSRIYDPNWTADEELALLGAVGRLGLGNWTEVADAVNVCDGQPPKKRLECEQHFYAVHCVSTDSKGARPIPHFPSVGSKREMHLMKQKAHAVLVGGWMPPCRPSLSPAPAGFNATLQGFMPQRGDFDQEWNNSKEMTLADADWRGNESPQERELKLQNMTNYCAVLDLRYQRKKLAVEFGFADRRRLLQVEQSFGSFAGALLQLMRGLNFYNLPGSGAPLNELVESLVPLMLDERSLLGRIEQLGEWKNAGLRTYAQIAAYETFRLACRRNHRGPLIGGLGYETLTEMEKSFCAQQNVSPIQLLFLKGMALRGLEGRQWTALDNALIDTILAFQLP